MALRVTIPLGAGETPASFASRMGAVSGLSAREFCLDWNIRFQDVVDGDAKAIAIIADKGGVPPADLAVHAFVRVKGHAFEHRGERLTRFVLRRKRVAVCPACLAADIVGSDRPAHLAAFGRANWQIDAVKTCPIHEMALVTISDDETPGTLHDFAHHFVAALPDLDGLVAGGIRRQPSEMEVYVVGRVDGGRTSPFLDTLPLFVAIEVCEMIGAVQIFGRKVRLKTLSDDDWRTAGAAGFAIASQGPPAIHDFLREMQATFPYSRAGTERPQALFGRFYQWLEFWAADPAYDPLRDLVGEYICTHLPMAAGDLVFGRPVEIRTMHSIRSLSLETGLHPKRLRKTLKAAGIITDAQDPLADANVIFDAEAGSSAVSGAKTALSRPQVEKYLNAPRVPTVLIVKSGLIKPKVAATGFGASDKYAVAHLDDFLSRLLADARPVRKTKPGQAGISAAAKRACCSAVDVLRLILDRKLAWVGRLAGVEGYLSVLVDVEEIRRLMRGTDHGGLTPFQLSKALGTSDLVARALIAHGHIASFTAVNPVNRCAQTVVAPAEVARFRKTYVALFALAKERGRHFRKVKLEFDDAGVEPAFDVNKIGATFYRMKDC